MNTSTVVLELDLQRWIVGLQLAPLSGAACVKQVQRLREHARVAGWAVVPVRFLRQDGSDGGANGEQAAFCPELTPGEQDRVVDKYGLSAYQGTALVDLVPSGARVLIAGIATEAGVLATALDAVAHGHRPAVVVDAVTGGSVDGHEDALVRLREGGVELVTLQSLVAPVLG